MGVPWTPRDVSASGQVFEFRLWALLTEQSRGSLHVFLPLADRGIDALVHRMSDGAYIAVQAKGRSTLQDGEVHITVWADSLRDDNALLVSGLLTEGALGPTMLVIPEGEFKHIAYLTSDRGTPVYSAEFGMRPRPNSRWFSWLVPTAELATRFGVPAAPAEALVEERRPEWRSDLGFLGESEVNRQLAVSGELNLFRPFPDNETAELAALHLGSRRVIGLQIKTVDVERARLRATVNVYAPSFRPAPTTQIVVLAWLRDDMRFHEDCLLIPTDELRSIAKTDHYGHLEFEFRPGARDDGLLVKNHAPLVELESRVIDMIGAFGATLAAAR